MNTKIQTRSIPALFGLLIIIMIGLASYTAQGQIMPYDDRNSGHTVKLSSEINTAAKAVPVNAAINGPFEELKPQLTPCGNRLYFSRIHHPSNTLGNTDAEDIWFSDYDQKTGEWSDPARLPGVLNNDGPNYVNNISATGDTLILGNTYGKKGKMRPGLSYSVNNNGQWSAPIDIKIQNDYNISDHSNSFVSLKNGVIIRAVKRCERVGGRDLYVSFWDGKVATEPVNMGTIINSDLDESSPFLAADNKTLYFASKGHDGYGNFDIYMTTRLDDTWTNWSIPQNLGPAVNGPMNDEFFSITQCGGYAMFSKQVSIHNTDVYRISLTDLFNKPQMPRMLTKPSTVASL